MDFHAPSKWQCALLDKLLSIDIEDIQTLRHQLFSCLTKEIDQDGSFRVKSSGEKWIGSKRVPIEGNCSDKDGTEIDILLHIVNGFLYEVEILRVDAKAPSHEFSLDSLLVQETTYK